eukprot:9239643-Pyramimonas_sp.AAC.2
MSIGVSLLCYAVSGCLNMSTDAYAFCNLQPWDRFLGLPRPPNPLTLVRVPGTGGRGQEKAHLRFRAIFGLIFELLAVCNPLGTLPREYILPSHATLVCTHSLHTDSRAVPLAQPTFTAPRHAAGTTGEPSPSSIFTYRNASSMSRRSE